MNQKSWIFTGCIVLLAIASPARAGDVLDRIVATVNNHIILQSEWQDAARYEAFVAGRALDQVQAADRKAALDHLIDQELLREQMRDSGFPHASTEEVEKSIQEIRKRYTSADSDADWEAALKRYGLTEKELKKRVALQVDLLGLVDSRLRPNVVIDSKSIESYYNQELLPQLRQSGAQQVPLAQVTPKIRELLTQQKMNELLVAWLQDLRSGSRIRTEAGSAESGAELR
ncbi:MAG TPA: SurA N-terminal domain-containing protein [Terriglobales bacterium]|nr:SurA N-terminal domain-containing protein [Terriglobales bacterium]